MAQIQTQKKLYIFGDQTFELQPHLRDLLPRRSDNPVLNSLLAKGHSIICAEARRLPVRTRDTTLAGVSSLEGLLGWEQRHDGNARRCIALEMALACLFQLSNFLLAQDMDELRTASRSDDSRLLGFCTGGLAATAISCSTTTTELVELGVEAVRVAFRTGALTDDASLSGATLFDQQEQSWATVVIGPGAAETVRSYCKQQEASSTAGQLPFITAFTPRGVTVSGTPTSLAQLRSSAAFEQFELKKLPLYGLYHAPHLFPDNAVQALFADFKPDFANRRCLVPVIFGSGDALQGDLASLLEAAVERILREPLRWLKVVEVLRDWCTETTSPTAGDGTDSSQLQIYAFGSKAGNLISKQTDVACSVYEYPAVR